MLASFSLSLPAFTLLALLFYLSGFLFELLLIFLSFLWLVEWRLLLFPRADVGTTVHSSAVAFGGSLVNFSSGRLNYGT
jgi:hypothetical protein